MRVELREMATSVKSWYETNTAVMARPNIAELMPPRPCMLMMSVAGVAERGNALLDVVHERLRPQSPLTLAVLADDSLGQIECARFCRLGLLLVRLGLINLDQSGMPPRRSVKGLGSCRGLLVLLGILFVHVGFFFRALRRGLPIAAEFVLEQMEGGKVSPFRAGKFLVDQLHPLLVDLAAHIDIAL